MSKIIKKLIHLIAFKLNRRMIFQIIHMFWIYTLSKKAAFIFFLYNLANSNQLFFINLFSLYTFFKEFQIMFQNNCEHINEKISSFQL